MNERIRELVNKAIGDVDYIRDDDDLNQELANMYIPDCFAEKFAELIVKECITLLPDDCQSKNGCHTSWSIKEHFGVEE